MVKVLVVYDTKHGNTRLVAENIADGLREVEGITAAISDVEKVDVENLPHFDAILMGSPNHFGGPARSIRKFIDKLGKRDMVGKWAAVFDTYLGGDFNKAVRKMEDRIGEKVPSLKLITSGLSVRVEGTKGPISEGELPKCVNFGKKIANQLKP
jgi:flavodoxin